ncbi:septation protein A [Candidatus Pandoraea novymonadis]|uniref:Inner membrane-spanning protein YciB n=1 Tax=Candidatus Pandoraea novymonadis TaxID=1808959 RepID=A0ABX5FEM2_9BURK|nr:septation protein A [Candidatus Pandoraea novymonadis]PSB92125.1 putative intracellular septation protein A [Candidatus Pandoraea novymonadis]
MKFLFDLLPLILFFIVFKFAGIYVATGTIIIVTLIQIIWMCFHRRKIESMQWISFAIIVIFGGATIWFHNEAFIKWKPTVLYWLFGVTLFITEHFFNRNLIHAMMGEKITLTESIWQKLSYSWTLFFIAIGALNLLIAYNFSTDLWVNFKLFGGMGLMLIFFILQSIWLSKHMKSDE